jgi:hypothetical protein
MFAEGFGLRKLSLIVAARLFPRKGRAQNWTKGGRRITVTSLVKDTRLADLDTGGSSS